MGRPGKGGITHTVLMELLADEEWHDLETVVRVGMASVPPGVALRRAEKDRELVWKREHPDQPLAPRKVNNDTDYLIRVGARRRTMEVLRNKSFEFSEDRTKVRLSENRKYQYNGRGNYLLREYRNEKPLTEEEKAELRKEQSRRGWRTRQINRGLDPDKPRVYEIEAQKRAAWEALSDEERKAIYAERARKAYQTRLAKRREQDGKVQSDAGHRGQQGDDVQRSTQRDRPRDR